MNPNFPDGLLARKMIMKKHKAKRQGLGLEIKSFQGNKANYVVFKTTKGSYHVFVETEAKAAARDCGGRRGNTRQRWQSLWQ
jgi:hypothetical protein